MATEIYVKTGTNTKEKVELLADFDGDGNDIPSTYATTQEVDNAVLQAGQSLADHISDKDNPHETHPELFEVTAEVGISGWTGTAPATKTQAITGLKATDKPFIDLNLVGVPYDTNMAQVERVQEEWNNIYRITVNEGSLTFYSMRVPGVSVPIKIMAVR